MPNHRFTISISQDFNRYYIKDIISKLVYEGCAPDNEEGQSFCKLNVMQWNRVLYTYFSVSKVKFLKINESRCIALLVPRGSIKKLFSIDCVDIYISQSIVNYLHRYFFFNRFKSVGVTPHCLYRDSLTLIYSYKLDPVFCLEKRLSNIT